MQRDHLEQFIQKNREDFDREIPGLNVWAKIDQTLEQRVEAQLAELERVGRLKRFLSPQFAELIVSS